MMDREHKAYRYAQDVCDGKINAPKYVKLQCKEFLQIADEPRQRVLHIKEKSSTDRQTIKINDYAVGNGKKSNHI